MTQEQYEYIIRVLKSGEPGIGDYECVHALRKLYESSQWQPIEAAPRDGREVLVWQSDGDANSCAVVARFEGGYWMDTVEGAFSVRPTHWRPLPEAPKEVRDGTL